jgi:hypothetical protein
MSDDPLAWFIENLQAASQSYKMDKRYSAHQAIAAVLYFLTDVKNFTDVKVDPVLRAPLLEALDIINSELDFEGLSKKDQDRVHASLAVTHQLEAGKSMDEALKALLDHDAKAKEQIRNFRENMMSKRTPKGAWELYHVRKATASARNLPPEELARCSVEYFREKIAKP